MNIVFIDPKCPEPYDSETLASRGLGGTEATVVRVARALSATHSVTVLQHNRKTRRDESPDLRYLPTDGGGDHIAAADHVIFVQKAQHLRTIAPHTRGRVWLWLHNYLGDEVPLFWTDHAFHRLGIICVSQTHAVHTRRHLQQLSWNRATLGWIGRAGVCYQYNPVDAGLSIDSAASRDPDKLVFFSSPYKGIEHVLQRFGELHAARPATRLYVADPGYIRNFDRQALEHPGIVRLGSLPQAEVLRHVRDAVCVFYPQYKRPETFGLVFAEANAVGTPVLAHDFGSAREILATNNPPLDARQPDVVRARILDWLEQGGPTVSRDVRFTIERVASTWSRFLAEPDTYMRQQREEDPR